MYNYNDKIEVLLDSTGSSGELEYDENGDPILPDTPSGETGGFEFLSDCRIKSVGSRSISGTYFHNYEVYLPKSLEPSKLPSKGSKIRLTKKDLTVKEYEATVIDSYSTRFNYVIKAS